MIKLAHVAVVTPHRCGLYETTRELVVALRAAGADSRIFDPTQLENPLHPGTAGDRHAPFAEAAWARQADVLINHSGLGPLDDSEQPVIHIAHGRPRSSFLSETNGSTPIYSYHYRKNADPRFKAVVTFWPEHHAYLEVMWPDTPVHVVTPPVDLERWTPDGPAGYKFHGKAGEINIVCTDAWRDDVDPFTVVNAFALWARKRDAKLHIYGNPSKLRGWAALLKRIQDDGNLGEVVGWVKGLENVYRAADLLITPHTIAVRSKREAMACGCPVAVLRNPDIRAFGSVIDNFLTVDRSVVRKSAEMQFNPENTAREFLDVVDSVAPKARAA